MALNHSAIVPWPWTRTLESGTGWSGSLKSPAVITGERTQQAASSAPETDSKKHEPPNSITHSAQQIILFSFSTNSPWFSLTSAGSATYSSSCSHHATVKLGEGCDQTDNRSATGLFSPKISALPAILTAFVPGFRTELCWGVSDLRWNGKCMVRRGLP